MAAGEQSDKYGFVGKLEVGGWKLKVLKFVRLRRKDRRNAERKQSLKLKAIARALRCVFLLRAKRA